MPKRRRRSYGTGTVYRRENDTWSYSVRTDAGRIQTHGFIDEKTARQKLAEKLGDLAAGREAARAAGPATLDQLATPWLEERKSTHRSAYDDANRWTNHLRGELGHLRPDAVTVAVLKTFVASKRRGGLSTTTVGLLVRLLSAVFNHAIEAGQAASNPVRALSKPTRRKYLKPKHDPKRTPFIEDMADVVRLYRALDGRAPAIGRAYALGAFAGLRTGEARALRWEHVDLDRGVIHVQVQVERRKGRDPATWSKDGTQTLKDDDSRVVPVQPSLAGVLAAERKRRGLVCPPLRAGRRLHLDDHTMGKWLGEELGKLGLARPGLRWYEATRHTFACQWVMGGGSLETLQRILGHSTVLVTERYAHLRPGHFNIADRNRLTVELAAPEQRKDVANG